MPPLAPAQVCMYPSVQGAKVSQGYLSVHQSHQLFPVIYEGKQPQNFCSFHILEKLLLPPARTEKTLSNSTPETICSIRGDGASPQQATSQARFL